VTLGVSFHEAAQRELDEATDFYATAVAHDRRRPFYWSGRR